MRRPAALLLAATCCLSAGCGDPFTLGEGWFRVTSKASGMVFAVAFGSTNPEANVVQWSWAGTPDQAWRFRPAGPNGSGVNDAWLIVTRQSGLDLAVNGNSTDAGAFAVQSAPLTDETPHAFRLVPVPDADGMVQIVSVQSGLALGLSDRKEGSWIVQSPPSAASEQQWTLQLTPDQ